MKTHHVPFSQNVEEARLEKEYEEGGYDVNERSEGEV